MLCEKCKKREARINLVKIVNGQKQEIWLCEECAKNIADTAFLNSMGNELEIPLQNFLTGMISNISQSEEKPKELVCPNCNMTEKELRENKKFGCSRCYDIFTEELDIILKDMNDTGKYVGKIPQKNRNELKQKIKLKNLKENLQQLILDEKYEEAAIVRDEIRELENNIIDQNRINKIIIQEESCSEKLD